MSAIVKVAFHGDAIEATDDGQWAIVKRLCENLGVDVEGQRKKLKAEAWATTEMISAVAEDGKNRDVFCIHRRSLAMWLVTIKASKVRPEIREKLIAYQREAADVLDAHFSGAVAASATVDPSVVQSLASLAASFASVAATQAMIVANQTALTHTIERLASGTTDGPSGRSFAATIGDKVRVYAEYQCNGISSEMKRWRGRGHRFLRGVMGFHAAWWTLPAHRRQDANIHMDELIRGARQSSLGRRQLSLVLPTPSPPDIPPAGDLASRTG